MITTLSTKCLLYSERRFRTANQHPKPRPTCRYTARVRAFLPSSIVNIIGRCATSYRRRRPLLDLNSLSVVSASYSRSLWFLTGDVVFYNTSLLFRLGISGPTHLSGRLEFIRCLESSLWRLSGWLGLYVLCCRRQAFIWMERDFFFLVYYHGCRFRHIFHRVANNAIHHRYPLASFCKQLECHRAISICFEDRHCTYQSRFLNNWQYSDVRLEA